MPFSYLLGIDTDLIIGKKELREKQSAAAITACAKEENVELLQVEGFHMIPGKGISAVIGGERLFCCNGAFLEEQGIEGNSAAEQMLERFRSQGKAVILVADAEKQKLLGAVTLSDTLRDASASMAERLRKIGTHAVLLEDLFDVLWKKTEKWGFILRIFWLTLPSRYGKLWKWGAVPVRRGAPDY